MDRLQKFLTGVIFDFDGVIKESLEIKTHGFLGLFPFADDTLKRRIKEHHETNMGVSRFIKIPLYMNWAAEPITEQSVSTFTQKYSELVVRLVVDSDWVPGVQDFIKEAKRKSHLYVVSATPRDELLEILTRLDLLEYFTLVFGSPKSKSDAVHDILIGHNFDRHRLLLIGDSMQDYLAAKKNGLKFILRRTKYNIEIQRYSDVTTIRDFQEFL